MTSHPVAEEVWKQEADLALSPVNYAQALSQLVAGLSSQLSTLARSGASGPFALWGREQVLSMTLEKLERALEPHICEDSLKMHLAGVYVHSLDLQMIEASRYEAIETLANQKTWVEQYFADMDVIPDMTFIETTTDRSTESYKISDDARSLYCAVLCDDILWRLDRSKCTSTVSIM